jgi:hypothetical protein
MITGDIIQAITNEVKYFLEGKGSYVLDTNLRNDITYSLPLVVIKVKPSQDSARLPGNGITRMGYDIIFDVYNYEPGSYNNDDGGYSSSLMDFIDSFRVFMCSENWLTNDMIALTSNYGFRMEFQGIQDAEPLEGNDTLYLGQKFTFDAIAFDNLTNATYDFPDDSGTISGTIVFQ